MTVHVAGSGGTGDIRFNADVSRAIAGSTPFQIIFEGIPVLGLAAVVIWGLLASRRPQSR